MFANNGGGIHGLLSMQVERLSYRRHPGARLALLAMLLLAVGPLLSQWLSAAPANPLPAPGCHEQPANPAAGYPEAPAHEALWAKCGYCTLLLSSPALTAAVLALAEPGAFATPPRVSGGARHVPASAVFPGSRSRAPPPLA